MFIFSHPYASRYRKSNCGYTVRKTTYGQYVQYTVYINA